MRILFVISSLGSGGAERVLTLVANALAINHEVTVATLSDEKPFYPLNPEVGHRTLGLLQPSHSFAERLFHSGRRIRVLRQLIQSENPDVIVSFMTQTNLLTLVAARTCGKPIVVSERIAYDFQQALFTRILRRLLYPLADALVTQTQADAKHYRWMKPVHVLPNPVAYHPRTSDFSEKDPIVLGVGRLVHQKGFDRLIDAFARLQRSDWKLVIAGEGPLKETLQAQIDRYGLRNAQLVGRQEEIDRWYRKAAIFVLSSHREGFPNVLLEAMAHGCACVAFDCPYGPAEIVHHGQNGLLVPAGDVGKLSQSLKTLVDERSFRTGLGKAAKESARKLQPSIIAGKWEELIRKAVR